MRRHGSLPPRIEITEVCTLDGCDRPHEAHGLCALHYVRQKKYGSTASPRPETDQARFMLKIEQDDKGCWLWTGTVFPKTGYANFWFAGKSHLGHRWSYRHFVGPIPVGYQLDHLCRVRHCVNPAHLEPVTPRENNARSTSPSALNAAKSHCKHGHEFTPENTYMTKKGQRYCITCRDARLTRRR